MTDSKLPLPTPPQPQKPVAADIPINPTPSPAPSAGQTAASDGLTPPPSTLNPQTLKPITPTPTQLKPPLPMPSPLAKPVSPAPLSTTPLAQPGPLPKPPVSPLPSPLKPLPGASGVTNATATPLAPNTVGAKSAIETPHIEKPGSGGNKPIFAQTPKISKKIILIVAAVLATLGVLAVIISSIFGNKKATPVATDTPSKPTQSAAPAKQTTLTYWGLWEPKDVMTGVLKDFETANPGILVNYVKQSPQDYRERLQTSIASGQGPDLFRFHATWTPMLKSELAPVPSSVMSTSDFQKNFYPVATQQLQLNGQYLGVPLMYDGLVLYYNEEIFKTANVQPPTTWAEIRDLAVKLTVKSSNGIERGGLAIGNASNVEHFSDIIGLLMLQNGADPKQPTSKNAVDALSFYTNFVKGQQVWSDKLPSSTTAFARGEAAMMFAPSWRAHDVVAMNPNLKFSMIGVPKLADKNVTWATYWAEGVSAQSKNKDASWLLIKYLSSPEVMQKLYSQQSQVRAFGEPYSRVDLAKNLATDKYLGGLFSDAPNAQSWYLCSYTHDNGLNDKMIKYYQDAVNAVLSNKSADEAMVTVDQGTRQLLRQYGLESATTTQTSSSTTGQAAGASGATITR